MALKEEFVRSGEWLFRWRSYLPVLLSVVIILGILSGDYSENGFFASETWEMIAFAVSLIGLAIRIYTVGHIPEGTSGRNTKLQVAFALNQSGVYSVLRHPLYLGNFFIWLGLSLFVHLWWVTLITVLVFWLYYERIMFVEEDFLRGRFQSEYERWAGITPAFIPCFRRWKKPEIGFSLRIVLQREYSVFFAIIMSFTVVDVVSGIITRQTLAPDPLWRIIFTIGLIVFLVLRVLDKKTTIFSVEGR